MLIISCTTAFVERYLQSFLKIYLRNHYRKSLSQIALIVHHDIKMNYEKVV